jgi:hypothetical protein
MPNRRRPASHRPEATMKQAQQTKTGPAVIRRPLPHYPRAFGDMLAERRCARSFRPPGRLPRVTSARFDRRRSQPTC